MLIKRPALACLALLATACAGDSGTSGVAGSTLITALTQEELIQLCNWVEVQEFTLPIRSECEGDAVFSVLTKAECEAERDTCIAEEPAHRDEATKNGRASCARIEVVPRPDCTATVAQLETCVNDTMAAQRAFYGALSCDMVNPDFDDDVPDPPSCARIDNSCGP